MPLSRNSAISVRSSLIVVLGTMTIICGVAAFSTTTRFTNQVSLSGSYHSSTFGITNRKIGVQRSATSASPVSLLKATIENTTGSEQRKDETAVVESFLSSEEQKALMELYTKAKNEDDDTHSQESDDEKMIKTRFVKVVEKGLANLSPTLIMKLKQGWPAKNDQEDITGLKEAFEAIATVLYDLSVERLDIAKTTLQSLLNAGEIKKLDALIGQAARDGNLDVAFFQVLQFNIQDAAMTEQQEQPAVNTQTDKPQGEESDGDDGEVAASRLQILQHVYTRCQEEVEKVIAPGVALLNKLLRTEQPSIRRNQLEHYLTPQPTKIRSPDGKEIDLGGSNTKTLVEHSDFVDALGRAVQQIRSVEAAGATTREVAAGMVESCRQVAKEARLILAESYGPNSTQVLGFETALEPVFRPTSTDSVYAPSDISKASSRPTTEDSKS